MKWINVDEKYLDFLRIKESRIPKTNYGDDKYKPFFGVLFEVGDLYYITQISHAQPRHLKMKNQPDFFKIFNPKNPSELIAVINLNYMFPIPKTKVTPFIKKNVDSYRTFKTEKEKTKYLDLLNLELKMINSLNLSEAAKQLYVNKYKFPDSFVSKRCLDYKDLENYINKAHA